MKYLKNLINPNHRTHEEDVYEVTPHYIIQKQVRNSLESEIKKYKSIKDVDLIGDRVSKIEYNNNKIHTVSDTGANNSKCLQYSYDPDGLTISDGKRVILKRKYSKLLRLPIVDVIQDDYAINTYKYEYEKIDKIYVLTGVRYQKIDKVNLITTEGELKFMYENKNNVYKVIYHDTNYTEDTSFTGFIDIDKYGRVMQIMYYDKNDSYLYNIKYHDAKMYSPTKITLLKNDLVIHTITNKYDINGNNIKTVECKDNFSDTITEREFDINNNLIRYYKKCSHIEIIRIYKIISNGKEKTIFEHIDDKLVSIKTYM